MYAALGAAAAGVASVGALVYSSRNSVATAQAKGREEGRREVLGQLLAFGPNRLRRMCLEIGVRFTEPEDEDDEDEDREIYEGLTAEIRAELKEELRRSMRGEVEAEVRIILRGEVEGDAVSMRRLRGEAWQLVKGEMERSGDVREEVRRDLKNEVRRELTMSGRDVAIVAEAMTELREESRDVLKSQLRNEIKEELRKEMEETVKKDLREELMDEVAEILKAEMMGHLREQSENTRSEGAERFLDTTGSVWTADTSFAGTTRR